MAGVLSALWVNAQILEPVHWHSEVIGDSIRVTATIDEGWQLSLMQLGDTEFDPWNEPEYAHTFTMMMSADSVLDIRYHVCDNEQCLAPAFYRTDEALLAQSQVGCEACAESYVGDLYADNTETAEQDHSLWWIFTMGLLAGLLAIFTPCVWPIIPMTVSFFIKRSGGKRGQRTTGAIRDAILYGLSIIILYVGLGLLVTLVFGASALNAMSTNAVVNIIFFLVLVLFAVSFFGAFEITLPSSWSTTMNEKSRSTAGFLSVLFMAFTLVIVSFSCTGPIIGTLLVEAAGKSLLAPAIGMLGFAIALALPFSLFAMFPSVMAKMPKSGGWMDGFKVTLAFLELALSLKFLSVADMAYGWGILPRWLFIALWAVNFFAMGVYYLWKIWEKEFGRIILRCVLLILSWGFTAYLIPGIFGAPVKIISAFAPPMEGENEFSDYEEALRYAKEQNKPILLDFTGYGCVNCRKMESYVLADKRVQARLKNYVVVSLYVDDKHMKEDGSESIGDYNSRLQRERFKANAQPFFVQLDSEGKQVGQPQAFTIDPEVFLEWLKY